MANYKVYTGSLALPLSLKENDRHPTPFEVFSSDDIKKMILAEHGINNEIPFDDKPVAEFDTFEEAEAYVNGLELSNIVSEIYSQSSDSLHLVVKFADIYSLDDNGVDVCDKFYCKPYEGYKRNNVLSLGDEVRIQCEIPKEIEWMYPEYFFSKKFLCFNCEMSMGYSNSIYATAQDAAERCATDIITEYVRIFGDNDDNFYELRDKVLAGVKSWFNPALYEGSGA